MASDGADTHDLIEGAHEPRECMACRGTGSVISNLGGTPSTVECPWCAGSGLRPPEADAQAHWGATAERAGTGQPDAPGELDAPSGAAPGEPDGEADSDADEGA